MLLAAQAVQLAQATQEITTRSRAWVWIVAVGLVLTVVLIVSIISAIVRSLPDDVRTPIQTAARQNSAPLGVGFVLVVGSIIFALWSAGLPTVTATNSTSQVQADGSVTPSGDGATVAPDGSSVTTPDGVAVPGGPATAAGTGGRPTTGRTTATTRSGASVGAPTVNVKEANLYTGAANTTGITNDLVKVCGHAALSLGAVLNTKPEDLLVFWRYLNDKGGIHGRKFEITLEDDQYTAEGGVPAAQACAERNPFMIFGALGSDVIPPVRVWAEQNRQLYLYGFTLKKGSEKLRYSYSATISQEDLSLVIADLAVRKHQGKKLGLLWRNSSNIQPGRDAFKNYVQSHGMKIVADLPVQKSQGSYTQEIITLQQAGAETVFILDDAVSQLNVMKQGKTQGYSPQWLVFTFNIQTQTLGDDSLNPPITGANLAPAYECHTFDGPYASYAADIKEFEAAYAKYSPNTDLCGIAGDIAWGGWLGFKGMAALFEACGRDCTRNRFAGVMESGYKASIGALCELDFTGDGHHGGFSADLMESYRGPNGRAALRNTQRCARAPG